MVTVDRNRRAAVEGCAAAVLVVLVLVEIAAAWQ